MGLIRKSLAVATLGTVKGNSKKQRIARTIARQGAETNRLLAETQQNEQWRVVDQANRRRLQEQRVTQRTSDTFADRAQQLVQLADLMDQGLVTADEFAEVKRRLLND